jgi:hypothetical protein
MLTVPLLVTLSVAEEPVSESKLAFRGSTEEEDDDDEEELRVGCVSVKLKAEEAADVLPVTSI